MPRRAVGIAGMVVGVLVIGVALFRSAADAENGLLRVLLLLALLAIATGSARAALTPDLHDWTAGSGPCTCGRGSRCCCATRGPAAARWRTSAWPSWRAELGVETVFLDKGLDLAQLAYDAIASGADCLGMAGGDGSQALVASIAIEHDIPFVCISAGTRNHFALDLGLEKEDPRTGMVAFRDGDRAPGRLRDRRRPAVRQQRVVGHLRHDRAAGGLPRGEEGDLPRAAARAAGAAGRAVRPAVQHARRHGGRRRVHDPGVQQPLRARAGDGHLAASEHVDRHPRGGRASPPAPAPRPPP